MNYKQALEFLENCTPKQMTFGLEAIEYLLDELSHPEKTLKIIHIAGTNGKGSVGAYLAYVFQAAGYETGRYISPSVFDYRERIQVSDGDTFSYISEKSVSEKLTKIKEAMKIMGKKQQKLPSPFEIETVMAFMEFAEKKCDIVILETGMGGRLDATNVFSWKEIAVFTSISMDHMGMLGDTIEKITKEKAGIIKDHMDVVCYDYGSGQQGNKIFKVLEETCQEKEAALVKADFSKLQIENMGWEGTDFLYKGNQYHINLLGENQPYNASVALETLGVLQKKFQISDKILKRGLANTKWPGRFELVCTAPILLADGAHNEDAAWALRRSLEFYFKGRKLIYIIGVFADKEYDKILKITSPLAGKIITIQSENARALPSWKLMEEAKKYCADVVDKKTLQCALDYVQTFQDEIVIAFGSLSFLGDLYRYYDKKRDD